MWNIHDVAVWNMLNKEMNMAQLTVPIEVKDGAVWITPDKVLPRDEEEVFLTVKDTAAVQPVTYTAMGWKIGEYWYYDGALWPMDSVIAWMPFPEPYKEEE